jgi:NAD(P)-dependent dehydrogenase (short-subunit alcohol dehydrogenase family)
MSISDFDGSYSNLDLALELGAKGIRCNAVAPGYINTPTNAGVLAGPEAVAAQEKRVAMGRMGTPEEVADVVASTRNYEVRRHTS